MTRRGDWLGLYDDGRWRRYAYDNVEWLLFDHIRLEIGSKRGERGRHRLLFGGGRRRQTTIRLFDTPLLGQHRLGPFKRVHRRFSRLLRRFGLVDIVAGDSHKVICFDARESREFLLHVLHLDLDHFPEAFEITREHHFNVDIAFTGRDKAWGRVDLGQVDQIVELVEALVYQEFGKATRRPYVALYVVGYGLFCRVLFCFRPRDWERV